MPTSISKPAGKGRGSKSPATKPQAALPVRRRSGGRRKNVSQSLYEVLRDGILTGRYPAGARLPAERELVELHGVNRGAVREAIHRLVQAKLVSTVHGGGSRVEPFLETSGLDLLATLVLSGPNALRGDSLRSLVEMRTAIAVDAARLAALRRSDAQLARIRALAGNLVGVADDAVLQERVLTVWEAVIDASGNIAYRLAYNTLREGYRLFGKFMGRIVRESFHAPDYRVLVDALATGDPARAERGARRIVEKEAAVCIARFGL